MDKFLNKLLGSKISLWLLRMFTDINSIHISVVRNRYTSEETIKNQVDLIIAAYNTILYKTGSPKIIDFHFHQKFENNMSTIMFTHEDISNGKNSRH